MFWPKSCHRCKGDLYRGRDTHGYYVACLQCGRYLTEVEEVPLNYPLHPAGQQYGAAAPPAKVSQAHAAGDRTW